MRKIINLFIVTLFIVIVLVVSYPVYFLNDKIIFAGYNNITPYTTSLEVGEIVAETSKKVSIEVMSVSNFSYDVGEYKDLTNEEVLEIKHQRKMLAEKYHSFLNKSIFEKFPFFNYENLYLSKYFPVIEFDVDSKILQNTDFKILNSLAEISDVKSIVVHANKEYTENSSYFLPMATYMNAYNDIANGTLTGDGVKVGIMDVGIIDDEVANYIGADLTIRNHAIYIETKSDHATAMGSIIGTSTGFAPDASLYSVEAYGNLSGEFDWLIDNDVDLVNMSFGTAETGTYEQASATTDYMIKNYGITCCVAVGNSTTANESQVDNPAMAYNALTVGMCSTDDYYMYASCYVETDDVDKPTISNVSETISIPNLGMVMSGTSISTAFTTGLVALLMEHDPTLKLYPAKVTALLTANSDYFTSRDYSEDCGLDDKVGSGSVNYGKAKSNMNNCVAVQTSSSHESGDIITNFTIPLQIGDKVRISICWLANSTGSVSSLGCNDYDVSLCRPSGAEETITWGTTGCVDMINYEAVYNGNHKLWVLVGDNTIDTSSQTLFICWSIE